MPHSASGQPTPEPLGGNIPHHQQPKIRRRPSLAIRPMFELLAQRVRRFFTDRFG
jgi:hypothetical protein